ncbi:hypothetical protein ACJX0J_006432, partial [Zea mays]
FSEEISLLYRLYSKRLLKIISLDGIKTGLILNIKECNFMHDATEHENGEPLIAHYEWLIGMYKSLLILAQFSLF